MSHNSAWNSLANGSFSNSLGQAGLATAMTSPYQQMTGASMYNTLLGQQAQQAQYNANRYSYDWVWNGKPVSITEFAELAYGDSPQKTMFLLKYSEKENKK